MKKKMKKTKKLLALLAVLVMAAALFGCGGSGDSGDSAQGAEETSGELTTLKVGMAGKDIKTVCVILAKELGYYEEEGLDVQFETVANLNDGVTALSQNKLDVLPFGFIPSATFISQGTDVEIIGGTISEGSQAIVKEENKDMIQDIRDFKGKKVGFMRPETGQIIMKSLMREAGLDLEKDVEFIAMDGFPSIAEGVSKGELDIGFVNSNYGYVAQQSGLAIAFDVGDYAPDTVCCRQTASRDAVDNKRDALVSFETANLRAYETYLNDKETTIQTLMEYSGQDEGYVEAAMYNGVMIPGLDPDTHKIEEMYEAMKANGDIAADTEVEITDHVDSTIYKDALEAMKDRFEDKDLYDKLMKAYEENNL